MQYMTLRTNALGAGEMVPRALAALSEDLGSIPSTHMAVDNHM